MKLKIKQLDEVAKWRKTSFKTSLTEEEVAAVEQKYGRENLYVHFDDGVPQSSRGANTTNVKPEKLWFEPEPAADLSKDPDERDFTLTDRASTTRVPQKSFNPQTKYNTPVGIYLYQLTYLREKLKIDDFSSRAQISSIPFAANSNFIYFYYIPRSEVVNLDNIMYTDLFDRTIKSAKQKFGTYSMESGGLIEVALQQAEFFTHLNDALSIANVDSALKSGTSLFKFFKDNAKSSVISHLQKAFARSWFYFTNNLMQKNINKWSKFLVDLGARALQDDGNGIIHPSEPYQSVVIDTGAAKLLIVKNNPNAGKKSESEGGTAETKKYEQWASSSDNPKILKRIFNLNNQILDGHLAYNKKAPKSILLGLLDRPYNLYGMIGSLLNNDSINIKDIREYIMKMMDHYKNTEAIATKHVGAYTTLRDSIHYFKDDDEYIDRAMKFFGDDRYGIIDFFNFVQPDNDKLKKMLVAVKPEIRKDLISGLIDNDKIVAVPDWIYWLWNQNLPANQLNIHILRQLFIKAREGEGIVFTEKAAGAFLDTIYKNTMNGQAEALLYKEDVAFIYKKFPSLDPFKYSKQVAEVRLREAAKRKTLLGRRF
jgi:hypothetical protein